MLHTSSSVTPPHRQPWRGRPRWAVGLEGDGQPSIAASSCNLFATSYGLGKHRSLYRVLAAAPSLALSCAQRHSIATTSRMHRTKRALDRMRSGPPPSRPSPDERTWPIWLTSAAEIGRHRSHRNPPPAERLTRCNSEHRDATSSWVLGIFRWAMGRRSAECQQPRYYKWPDHLPDGGNGSVWLSYQAHRLTAQVGRMMESEL